MTVKKNIKYSLLLIRIIIEELNKTESISYNNKILFKYIIKK